MDGFTKQLRLNRQDEYQLAFHGTFQSRDRTLIVVARKNDLPHARLGLAISSNSVRRAVARNRLKRLIRESFRKNQRLLNGLDVVVTTSKTPGPFTNKSINTALQEHWQRLATCKESSSA